MSTKLRICKTQAFQSWVRLNNWAIRQSNSPSDLIDYFLQCSLIRPKWWRGRKGNVHSRINSNTSASDWWDSVPF